MIYLKKKRQKNHEVNVQYVKKAKSNRYQYRKQLQHSQFKHLSWRLFSRQHDIFAAHRKVYKDLCLRYSGNELPERLNKDKYNTNLRTENNELAVYAHQCKQKFEKVLMIKSILIF